MRNPRRLVTLFIAAFLISTPMFAATTVVFVADFATVMGNYPEMGNYPDDQTVFHVTGKISAVDLPNIDCGGQSVAKGGYPAQQVIMRTPRSFSGGVRLDIVLVPPAEPVKPGTQIEFTNFYSCVDDVGNFHYVVVEGTIPDR